MRLKGVNVNCYDVKARTNGIFYKGDTYYFVTTLNNGVEVYFKTREEAVNYLVCLEKGNYRKKNRKEIK